MHSLQAASDQLRYCLLRTFIGIAIHNMSAGGKEEILSANLSAAIRGEAGGILGTSVVAGDLVSFLAISTFEFE